MRKWVMAAVAGLGLAGASEAATVDVFFTGKTGLTTVLVTSNIGGHTIEEHWQVDDYEGQDFLATFTYSSDANAKHVILDVGESYYISDIKDWQFLVNGSVWNSASQASDVLGLTKRLLTPGWRKVRLGRP